MLGRNVRQDRMNGLSDTRRDRTGRRPCPMPLLTAIGQIRGARRAR